METIQPKKGNYISPGFSKFNKRIVCEIDYDSTSHFLNPYLLKYTKELEELYLRLWFARG